MKVSEFDYHLPPEFIAQQPAEKRDHSKLMILDRRTRSVEHRIFYQIVDYLYPGDLLVLNDTKVMPASIVGVKQGGSARIEVLLVGRKQSAESSQQIWECLVRPGKRLRVGARIVFGQGELIGQVLEKLESGEQVIEFEGDLEGYLKRYGEIPLPPYVNTKSEARNPKQIPISKFQLQKRYQTVYAQKEGATAAPTAGLHFTPELLKKIKAKGTEIAYLTLHTGLATFKPVYAENVEEHKMYSESYEVPAETLAAFKKAKRIVAVGTTTVRALESYALDQKLKGTTGLYIYPGFKFKMINAMITNFHFPRSTLLMLVSAFAGAASADKSAFAGRDFIFRAYREAMEKEYRFFSFGDAMLVK
jgi:S-adenosylmethionine:tRNA ribosyltransferase-isomerase